MKDYIIMTDSSSDLPFEYLEEHDVRSMSLFYIMEDKTYKNDGGLPYKEFYKKMREGNMPTTSQVNPSDAKNAFLSALKDTNNILYIGFSSGLSGTVNSARIAAEEIMEDRNDVRIIVIDSLAASLGQGLMVHKAVMMHENGKDIDEVANWIEEHKQNFTHVFTVYDLMHLYRGGRVSKTAATIGTIINLKPILHVDSEGCLINLFNVRGRKKSLNALVDYMEKKMGSYAKENDIVFISHGDSEEDANYVAQAVKERFGIESFLINPVGPTIGSHSGPDTLALFFMGEER